MSVPPDPRDFPRILYPLVVCPIMPSFLHFPAPGPEDAPGSANRRLSCSYRLQLAFWEQSAFLWKYYVQEGVCCGLFRIIVLWHPIMSYLRSQVIKPATLSSLGKETSQFQRAMNLTCIKDLL